MSVDFQIILQVIAIGVGFAAVLVALGGLDWLHRPTLVPALLVGVFTVVFPFF